MEFRNFCRASGSIVSLPLEGRDQGWGSSQFRRATGSTPTRLPPPSPQRGRENWPHGISCPPFTSMICPVTYPDSVFEARNR